MRDGDGRCALTTPSPFEAHGTQGDPCRGREGHRRRHVPGPMRHGKPVSDPGNMGGGSVESDFERALGCAVQVINDAAMQALPWEHHA